MRGKESPNYVEPFGVLTILGNEIAEHLRMFNWKENPHYYFIQEQINYYKFIGGETWWIRDLIKGIKSKYSQVEFEL